MQSDAETEYERVRTKYAPARAYELVIVALAIGILGVATIYDQIAPADAGIVIIVAIVMDAIWEFTKLRLRRNARDFAESTR
jgi:hypothetical protein